MQQVVGQAQRLPVVPDQLRLLGGEAPFTSLAHHAFHVFDAKLAQQRFALLGGFGGLQSDLTSRTNLGLDGRLLSGLSHHLLKLTHPAVLNLLADPVLGRLHPLARIYGVARRSRLLVLGVGDRLLYV